MTDPRAAERKAPAGGRRTKTFGDRTKVVLRMGAHLAEQLMAHCTASHVPANTYLNSLIETAMARADPNRSRLKAVGTRGEDKVMVTLRMDPDLRERLTDYCADIGVSANNFVCGLVMKDLRQRGYAERAS